MGRAVLITTTFIIIYHFLMSGPCQESDTLHFSELRDLGALPIYSNTPNHHEHKQNYHSINTMILLVVLSQSISGYLEI